MNINSRSEQYSPDNPISFDLGTLLLFQPIRTGILHEIYTPSASASTTAIYEMYHQLALLSSFYGSPRVSYSGTGWHSLLLSFTFILRFSSGLLQSFLPSMGRCNILNLGALIVLVWHWGFIGRRSGGWLQFFLWSGVLGVALLR